MKVAVEEVITLLSIDISDGIVCVHVRRGSHAALDGTLSLCLLIRLLRYAAIACSYV